MNNNRNWEREIERERYKQERDAEAASFANCLSGWHSVSQSVCQTVSDCVSVCVNALTLNQISTDLVVRLTRIGFLLLFLGSCHPVCLNYTDCALLFSFFFVCVLFPTPGHVFTLTHLECLHHLGL